MNKTYCYRKRNTFYRLDEQGKICFVEKRCSRCKTFFLVTKTRRTALCLNCRHETEKEQRKRRKELQAVPSKVKTIERPCMGCLEPFLSQGTFNRYCPKCIEELDAIPENYRVYKMSKTL